MKRREIYASAYIFKLYILFRVLLLRGNKSNMVEYIVTKFPMARCKSYARVASAGGIRLKGRKGKYVMLQGWLDRYEKTGLC